MNGIKNVFLHYKELFLRDKLSFFLECGSDGLYALILLFFPLLGTNPYNYILIGLTGLFCVFAAIYIVLKGKILINKTLIALIFACVYGLIVSLIQVGWSGMLQTILLFSALLCVASNYSYNFKKSAMMCWLYVFGQILFSLVLCFVYREDILSFSDIRIGSEFENVNTVGMYLALGVIVSLYLIIKHKGWAHLLLIPVLIFLVLILLTGSRMSLIMALASVLVAIFLYFGKKHLLISTLLVLGCLVLGILILQFPPFAAIRTRLSSLITTFLGLGSGDHDYSGIQRFGMILDGFSLWLNNLFFGYGFTAFSQLTNYGTYSHATLIESLVSIGLIGTIPLYYAYLSPCFHSRWKDSSAVLAILFAIACILFGSFFSMFITNKASYFILIILLSAELESDPSHCVKISLVNNKRLKLSIIWEGVFVPSSWSAERQNKII